MAVRGVLVALAMGLPVLLGCSPAEKAAVVPSSLGSSEEAGRFKDAKAAPVPRISPQTHLAAGRMLEGQGNFKGAIEQYEKAIASNPRFVMAYNGLGILYQRLGRLEDAEHILKQGIRADPGAAILRNNLGYCYLERGRFEEAEKEFREALVSSPEFQRARMNLAIALAQRGRVEESLVEFSRVVPADVAHYNVAVICLNRKDYTSAESSFQRALEVNPDCPGAKEQLERVAAIVRALGGRTVDSELAEATAEEANGVELASERVEAIPLAGSADEEGTDAP